LYTALTKRYHAKLQYVMELKMNSLTGELLRTGSCCVYYINKYKAKNSHEV